MNAQRSPHEIQIRLVLSNGVCGGCGQQMYQDDLGVFVGEAQFHNMGCYDAQRKATLRTRRNR